MAARAQGQRTHADGEARLPSGDGVVDAQRLERLPRRAARSAAGRAGSADIEIGAGPTLPGLQRRSPNQAGLLVSRCPVSFT
jgi:hypothetical protein